MCKLTMRIMIQGDQGGTWMGSKRQHELRQRLCVAVLEGKQLVRTVRLTYFLSLLPSSYNKIV